MIKSIFAASLFLGFSFCANASFVHTDYLAEGDALATLDTTTGIEWLKLPNTIGMSLDYINEATSRNGDLWGWRLPTEDEIAILMNGLYKNDYRNQGPTLLAGSSRIEKNIALNRDWFTYMGGNKYVGTYVTSYGLSLSDEGNVKANGYRNDVRYTYGSQMLFHIATGFYSDDVPSGEYSYFLVSDGGVTLSSKANPELNQNNPDAPVNDVPVGVFFSWLPLLGLSLFRKNQSNV